MSTAVVGAPWEELGAVSESDIRRRISGPGQVRSWLESQNGAARDCVGHSNDGEGCPLATWLQETTTDYSINVRKGRLTWQLGEIPLPGWMCRFVFLVDGLHKEDKHVTTDTALSVLAIGDDVDSKAPVPAPVLEPALAV